jgi:hypothetical protein
MGTAKVVEGEAATEGKDDALSPEALVDACHAILDAAAALVMNVEFMTKTAGSSAEVQAVAADMRASVDRIAKVARALQGAARERT